MRMTPQARQRLRPMATVLVIDDEREIATIARDYLERAGYQVVVASDGAAGLDTARRVRPDLVVLDLGLPRLDGLEVARSLRRESDVPIVMLTARVDESDRLRGFDVGADDYITKPFSPRELVARISTVLRRARYDPSRAKVFSVADLTIDVPKMRVVRSGAHIDLTPSEFQLLAALARYPGRVFTRAQLLDAVRGSEVEAFERAIDAHVKNVRRKLEPDPRRPRYVQSVYGIGYRFSAE
jgi:two-component system, OmpR family, alkaline phosphatase synthesis response regulator PhoP